MKWVMGSAMLQNTMPVAMPPHREMTNQLHLLIMGLASLPPILMLPTLLENMTHTQKATRPSVSRSYRAPNFRQVNSTMADSPAENHSGAARPRTMIAMYKTAIVMKTGLRIVIFSLFIICISYFSICVHTGTYLALRFNYKARAVPNFIIRVYFLFFVCFV